MKKAVMFLSLALLVACSGMGGLGGLLGPRTLSLSQAQMEAALAKRFPFNGEFAKLIDVQALAPKLRLLPESNRIATDLTLALSPKIIGGKFSGALSVDSALRFEPSDGTVRLANPRVSKFDITGLSGNVERGLDLQRIGQLVIEQALNDFIVHTVKPEDLKRGGTTWKPGEFKVTSSGLELTLTPEGK
jgi:hypothetical protein